VPPDRLLSTTPRSQRVAPATGALRWGLLVLLVLAGAGPGAARAEEPAPVDLARELRRAARTDLPIAERVAAAEAALSVKVGGDPEAWARASLALLGAHDDELAAWMLLRATHEGLRPSEWVTTGLLKAEILRQARSPSDRSYPPSAALVAMGLLLGRGSARELFETWPPTPVVAACLADLLGPDFAGGDALGVRRNLETTLPLRNDLGSAASNDEAEARAGLEALVARGEAALPLLVSQAKRLAAGVPTGHLAQGMDVLSVLGQLGRREATPVLIACLEAPQGWTRYAAASALADLKDPAAAVALARQLVYAGDPFRARESWDFPGTTESKIPPEAWPSVEYYVIDVAAADALLTLGARGAAGWLIRNALNPARRNLRIRVAQDALDSLRRHLPGAPLPELLVEGGLPQRFEAFEALDAWWRMHRDDVQLLAVTFQRDDPAFRETALALSTRLTQPKVLELMIAKDACEILGAAVTPALTQVVGGAKPGAQTELARALARTRDPAAAAPLLGLLRAPQGFVRAAAAEVLDVYAGRDPAVVTALVAALDDSDCGVRLAAMKGLAGAPPAAATLAAVRAHDEAQHVERCGADANFGWARTTVLLVQEGAVHWPALERGLLHEDRVVRRTAWDLLRTALDLPEHLFDPLPVPGAAGTRSIDSARVLKALERRRAP